MSGSTLYPLMVFIYLYRKTTDEMLKNPRLAWVSNAIAFTTIFSNTLARSFRVGAACLLSLQVEAA
jgi:hypothetical protein